MRRSIFNFFLFLFITTGLVNTGNAEIVFSNLNTPTLKSDFTKKINKEFSISSDGEVELRNKYGKVDIKTWGKNMVKIDVTITIKARSQSAADDVFKRINIDFSNSSDNVRAETQIESSKKNSWGGKDNYNSFQIDYEVSMPKGCSLELANKYGHSTVAELDGEVNADIKYGNIYLEGVNEEVKLILGYGEGTIVKAKDIDVDVKYSKLKIKEATDVALISKYSKVYIDQADDVRSQSKYDSYRLGDLRQLDNEGKYDNFEINSIDLVKTTTKYSDFDVEELSKEGAFTMDHGNVAIRSLLAGFTSLNLTGKYADFKVNVADNAGYSIDVEAKYASVHYSNDLDITYEKQKSVEHFVKGTKGSGGGTIRARVEYGGVKVY